MYRLVLCLTVLTLTACYEDTVGCLNPDAANYDLQADEACPDDCCTFPSLAVRVTPRWEEAAVVAGGRYPHGSPGDSFTLVRFRFYLGELQLEADGRALPPPEREVELFTASGGSATPVILNGNYLLATTQATTTTIGTVRTEGAGLTALTGTYGLPERYQVVDPFLSPTGDALRTQPGRLNFNNGLGYVQSRLEYVITPGDTLSVSSYGSLPFALDFGTPFFPPRGSDLRIDLSAQLDELLGPIDLSADSATIAAQLGRTVDFLQLAPQ